MLQSKILPLPEDFTKDPPQIQILTIKQTKSPRFALALTLFFFTFVTTLWAGYNLHVNFLMGSGNLPTNSESTGWFSDLLLGLPFSLTILTILMAHEMGHYLACRHYGLDASLPYTIPAPIPFPFGTLGAVIKIKSPFQNRRQLFDVGIAGPLAGFVFIVPALIIGLRYSTELANPQLSGTAYEFGEPLLFRLATILFYPAGDSSNMNLHPIGWASWFGMLATGMNLLPIGQLDGSHITYALLGHQKHRTLSYGAFGGLIIIGLSSFYGYLGFALILLLIGLNHPPPSVRTKPLCRKRILTSIAGLGLLVLTFMPVPVRLIESIGRP